MNALLGVPGALGAFGVALLIFGFAPGIVLALVLRLLAKDDPRRRELQAELYVVPRWERPFWVCEQLEVALREGLFPEVSWHWGRWVWHRAKIEHGLDWHRRYPDSFEVPSVLDKAQLAPGDSVRLMWSIKRYAASGERMWVEILDRDGDRLVGRLKNWAMFVHLAPDATVKFHIDDIIDCHFDNEETVEADPADPQRFEYTHTTRNGCGCAGHPDASPAQAS